MAASSAPPVQAEAPPTIRVEVVSDVACPWCWVGWNRLNQAMEDLSGQCVARFDAAWHAFLLDPHFPEGGEAIASYYQRRFGSQARALRQRLHDTGKWDGAPFADWRWRANTEGAHELVALAGRAGKSHEAAGLMFRKTYEQGANLSESHALLEAAAQLGLPAEQVEAWLGSKEAREAVAADDEEAKASGIHSVPTFTISCGAGKPIRLVGAEGVKAFEVAFRKALHEAGRQTGHGSAAQAVAASEAGAEGHAAGPIGAGKEAGQADAAAAGPVAAEE